MHVIKRSGKKVDFDKSKILNAIKAANNDIKRCDKKAAMQYKEIMAAATIISHNIKKQDTDISVEDIQDLVEKTLMESGHYEVAKAYILYRQRRKEQRDAAENLMKSYDDLLFADAEDMDLKRDNANINTDAPMGIMLKLGAEGAKSFAKNFALPKKFTQMHVENYVHTPELQYICETKKAKRRCLWEMDL